MYVLYILLRFFEFSEKKSVPEFINYCVSFMCILIYYYYFFNRKLFLFQNDDLCFQTQTEQKECAEVFYYYLYYCYYHYHYLHDHNILVIIVV